MAFSRVAFAIGRGMLRWPGTACGRQTSEKKSTYDTFNLSGFTFSLTDSQFSIQFSDDTEQTHLVEISVGKVEQFGA